VTPVHALSDGGQLHVSASHLQWPVDVEELIGRLRRCQRQAGWQLAVVHLQLDCRFAPNDVNTMNLAIRQFDLPLLQQDGA